MPEKRWQLIFGFAAIGLLFVALSFYYARTPSTSDPTGLPIGQIERRSGEVLIFRNGYTQKNKVSGKAPLYSLDSIETQDIGEALLLFESAFKVKVLPNSLITLERVEDAEDFHVALIIKRGDIHIESVGREKELVISKNGENIYAVAYNDSVLAKKPVDNPLAVTDTSTEATSGLSEEDIRATMSSHRNSFFKCYTQLLQKKPEAKGDVSLTFTIENSGRIGVVDIQAPALTDEDFRKCLQEVVARVQFPPFSGSPISALFPIKFE